MGQTFRVHNTDRVRLSASAITLTWNQFRTEQTCKGADSIVLVLARIVERKTGTRRIRRTRPVGFTDVF